MATRKESIEQKIARYGEKLQQLKATKQQLESREKSRSASQRRRDEDRRKILAGAFLLDRLGQDGLLAATFGGVKFSDWLVRAGDRALFELPPLPPAPGSAPETGASLATAS